MQLALNGATTMKADLETDIRAASEARFDWLEIWAPKLQKFLESHDTADLNNLLNKQNLKPYSINSIERITFRSAEEHRRLVIECEALCRVASELNCPFIVVVPSSLPAGVSRSEVVEQSTRVLDELGRVADRRGVSLAFEFLGQADCSVRTLTLAYEIIRRVNRENVGLVIDSFHFYTGGSTLDSIEALDPDRLFILHINDAENLPREQLEDRHRLLPGLGILPLRSIVNALKSIGYDGVASVEIFRPEYWERDPFELALEARSAAELVLES